jgi:arginase
MSPHTAQHDAHDTLRLVWPQWQGATAEIVAELLPEVEQDEARRGYTLGTRVLEAILPAHSGPTEIVPVEMGTRGLDERDGIESKDAVLHQLAGAVEILEKHSPARVVTLGGECSVSVAPFTHLAQRYGDDLAVVWIDSHPDVGTPTSGYHGYHAMAVSAITGHGDPDVLKLLPATIDPRHVALAGLHSWTEDDYPNAAAWGISTFSPEDLRTHSDRLLAWLAATGCTKVAIHLDVDVIDSDEVILGLGVEPGGLTTTQVRRLLADVAAAADVVGITIAEYIPRQVLQLRRLLDAMPLLSRI